MNRAILFYPRINPIIALLFFLLTFYRCGNAQQKTKYLNQLSDKSDFKLLNGKPLSSKYGEVDAIKVVYDLEHKKIYYLNSKNYKYHHGFCSKKLGDSEGLEYFNKHNYATNSSKRAYLLGNVNYYQVIDKYVMDLSPADLINISDIELLYDLITKSSFFATDLVLLLNTSRLIDQKQLFKIPVITPEQIYKDQQYQALSLQTATGFLRFVSLDDLKKKTFHDNEILVLKETPNSLPLVAGVISSEFQTPLSHLSILGKNRKIPIMTYKDAFENSNLLKLKNQYVLLTVSKNTYKIRTVKERKKNDVNQLNHSYIKLHKDLSIDSLVGFNDLKNVKAKSIGNKAKNFATLSYLSQKNDFKVPESGFAIPFYFYDQHINQSKATILINELLTDIKNDNDSIDLKSRLKVIRKLITSSPIDKNLLIDVSKKAIYLGNFKRLRFRSSTNAEDLKGFSGAGLYTSKTGIIGDPLKSVESAIKKVWASLWSYRAFRERSYYHINQKKVAMGILVHRSFPNEIANGVAITKNIYRESSIGFVINTQLGNESVVKPSKNVVCDQIICYEAASNKIYTEKDIIEVITKSSLNNNQLILSDQEIIHLTKQLEAIKRYYFNQSSYPDYISFGLDIEFKIDTKERTLYIKQVRHYNG